MGNESNLLAAASSFTGEEVQDTEVDDAEVDVDLKFYTAEEEDDGAGSQW